MLQRNPQALDHHLSHESQLTGRGQHMPEEGHSDIAGIQSVASICTRSVIRPLLKYTAWPACPPEVSSRHCEIHKLREFMEHLMMICGFYCLQKKFGILVAQHFRSDPEVTHCMSGWHVEGHSDIAGIHSPGPWQLTRQKCHPDIAGIQVQVLDDHLSHESQRTYVKTKSTCAEQQFERTIARRLDIHIVFLQATHGMERSAKGI